MFVVSPVPGVVWLATASGRVAFKDIRNSCVRPVRDAEAWRRAGQPLNGPTSAQTATATPPPAVPLGCLSISHRRIVRPLCSTGQVFGWLRLRSSRGCACRSPRRRSAHRGSRLLCVQTVSVAAWLFTSAFPLSESTPWHSGGSAPRIALTAGLGRQGGYIFAPADDLQGDFRSRVCWRFSKSCNSSPAVKLTKSRSARTGSRPPTRTSHMRFLFPEGATGLA